MDTSAKRKWVIAAVILLVAAALGAACMNVWQDRSFQNKGKGYVVVIRIDGPIYGGAGSESVLNSSEGVSSEDLMRQFQAARKDPQAKAILVRINSPGGSTGATQEIAEEMDKVRIKMQGQKQRQADYHIHGGYVRIGGILAGKQGELYICFSCNDHGQHRCLYGL